MKAYGLPRVPGIEYPDVGDIRLFGLASHVGRLQKWPGGEYRGYCRANHKAKSRRYFKRRARTEGKKEIINQMK